jgi:hypothetical protein
VIRGLVITHFDDGIFISSGTGYKVEGNYIGTDPSGTVDEIGSEPDHRLDAILWAGA